MPMERLWRDDLSLEIGELTEGVGVGKPLGGSPRTGRPLKGAGDGPYEEGWWRAMTLVARTGTANSMTFNLVPVRTLGIRADSSYLEVDISTAQCEHFGPIGQ